MDLEICKPPTTRAIAIHPPGCAWARFVLGLALLLGMLMAASTAAMSEGPVNQPAALSGRTIPDFVDLVARVKPAVVSITSRLQGNPEHEENDQGGQGLPFPFNRMFPQSRAVEARGSGYIVRPDGTIVTNNHVVEDAISVTVTLDDGSELPARIVGRDPLTDIAVLKVAATHPLPHLELGESATVHAGEWVVAIGNPFGLGGSATAGIISAYHRAVGDKPYEDFIQVDAPINPGNSGGPLFTQDGKVIGMTTAILSPSGGSVGIGFAIPSDVIKAIVPQLEASGHVVRGFIGVESQGITPSLAKALNLPDEAGALVASVQPDSPASRAGLEPGDVVRAVDGQAVADPGELAMAIARVHPGNQTRLDIVRNGEAMHVTITVATLPEKAAANTAAPKEGEQAALGLTLGTLSAGWRRELGVPAGTNGAVVLEVAAESLAEYAGIRAHDVIVDIDKTAVTSARAATSAIQQAATAKTHVLLLRLFRDGQFGYVAIDVTTANKG